MIILYFAWTRQAGSSNQVDGAPEPGRNVGAVLQRGWHGFFNPTRGLIMFAIQVREHGIPVLITLHLPSRTEVVIGTDCENASCWCRFALLGHFPSGARGKTNYAFARSVDVWVPTDVDRLNALARIYECTDGSANTPTRLPPDTRLQTRTVTHHFQRRSEGKHINYTSNRCSGFAHHGSWEIAQEAASRR